MAMSRSTPLTSALAALALAALAGCGSDLPRATALARASLARGGKLYDNWQAVTGVTPDGDNPAYASTQGTAKGAATWRCRECHGVDYRGADGNYGSGSHFTGVMGLVASANKSQEELFAAIHDGVDGTGSFHYGTYLSDDDVWDLVRFIRAGIADVTPYLDSAGNPLNGDVANGKVRYGELCVRCHGEDGTKINFGNASRGPRFIRDETGNGFNFVHRVRFGLASDLAELDAEMPAAIDAGWTVKDAVDVLTYARTLPSGTPPATTTPATPAPTTPDPTPPADPTPIPTTP
jgi:thiosulfate dehydrogenase